MRADILTYLKALGPAAPITSGESLLGERDSFLEEVRDAQRNLPVTCEIDAETHPLGIACILPQFVEGALP